MTNFPNYNGRNVNTYTFPDGTSYTVTYYCTECANNQSALAQQMQVCEHLRAQYAKLHNELEKVKEMREKQAKTIFSQMDKIRDLQSLQDEVKSLKAQNELLSRDNDDLRKAYAECESRVKDHKIRFEQALKFYDTNLAERNAAVNELTLQVRDLKEGRYTPEGDTCPECSNYRSQLNKFRLENGLKMVEMQRNIEDQNRMLGERQETINNLRIALNKAKETTVVKQMPAEEIVRSFEDKINRLLDVIQSKEVIIQGLQDFISRSN